MRGVVMVVMRSRMYGVSVGCDTGREWKVVVTILVEISTDLLRTG